MIDACPETYAKHLAGYIRDPSTIRARTLDAFGRAPPLQRIIGYRSEVERLRARPHNTYLSPRFDNDRHVRVSDREPARKRPARGNFIPPNAAIPREWSDFARMVARSFGFTLGDVVGPGQQSKLVGVRHLIAVLLFERGHSHRRIGIWLRREPNSIRHALRSFEPRAADDVDLAKAYAFFGGEA